MDQGASYNWIDWKADPCPYRKGWRGREKRMKLLEKKELIWQVERILHIPGNYQGGILEMALILDYHIPKELLEKLSDEILTVLQTHSAIFRNVRLNLVKWVSDQDIRKEVSSVGMVRMGRCFQDYERGCGQKSYDELTRQLKLFYARSKLILFITDGSFQIKDSKQTEENLKPFLQKKLIQWKIGEE